MKRISQISLLSVLVLGLMSFSLSTNNWVRLGTKKVNFVAEKDIITVGATQGTFTKLKLVVQGAPITMHKCIIHFGNGSSQNINTRHQFNRNSSSRILDLSGNKRVIKKITLVHDTKNRVNKRATVTVFGRR